MTTHCGFVAIVGRPNVGKSTLLNALIGEKISITANKPQTTRHRILGIKTLDVNQIVYVDTPGMHLKQTKAINKIMNKAARSSLSDVDAVLFVIEALNWTKEDDLVMSKLQYLTCPVILLINKIDRVKQKDKLLPYMQKLQDKFAWHSIIPISAIKDSQSSEINDAVIKLLPESPFYFDENQTTDRPEKFRLAEIVREKLTRILSAELPYALAVEVEHMQQQDEQLQVSIIIWIERASQKAIVVGKDGAVLKRVGSEARQEMNKLLNTRVHLNLWVKLRSGWSDDKKALQNLGFIELE